MFVFLSEAFSYLFSYPFCDYLINDIYFWANPKLGFLDIPEGFSQSMSPIIDGKINFPDLFFKQGIDRLNRERL